MIDSEKFISEYEIGSSQRRQHVIKRQLFYLRWPEVNEQVELRRADRREASKNSHTELPTGAEPDASLGLYLVTCGKSVFGKSAYTPGLCSIPSRHGLYGA